MIAIIQKPTHHVRRDVPRAVSVKPVLGHELELSIGSRQRSLEGARRRSPTHALLKLPRLINGDYHVGTTSADDASLDGVAA